MVVCVGGELAEEESVCVLEVLYSTRVKNSVLHLG